jgi:ubiquinone/menaquinone biosynthesis C-methylase UbiE
MEECTMPATHFYSEALVLRTNELFYDLRNEEYAPIHHEMLGREGERWRDCARRYFRFNGPATVLDVGCGAGLVPMSVAGTLRRCDRMICADISAGMLEIARCNLAPFKFYPLLEFVKVAGSLPYQLPFAAASIDALTINSALHHIKDTAGFLREVDRVLKPGGLVMIGHEPNRRFHECRLLRRLYLLLMPFFVPKNVLVDTLKLTGLHRLVARLFYLLHPAKRRAMESMMKRINDVVLDEHLLERPLNLDEIAFITDIHDADGFYGDNLLPEYDLLDFETYHPMNLISIKYPTNRFVVWHDAVLAKRFPAQGATFFAVYRKRGPGGS